MPDNASASTDPASSRPLPTGWRWVRLGEVLTLRKELIHPKDNPSGEAVFVGLEHIESTTGVRTGSATLDLSHLTGRKPRFYEDDIVYGYLRPYLNKVWLAEFDGLCSVDQYVYYVSRDLADPGFVAWFMRSRVYLSRAPIVTTPGQLPRIRTEEVASVELALPPLSEQRRIAALLQQQLAAVARARAAAVEQVEAAGWLAGAYLREAFGAIAEQVPRRPLAELCELLPSKSIATDGDAEVQAITTACLTESGFRSAGMKRAKMWADDAQACLVRPGEILVARSNTSELVGRTAMYEGQPPSAVASDLTIRIWLHDGIHPRFLAGYLSYLYTTGFWKERAGGASGSMKKITRGQIMDLQAPVPPWSEQERLARWLRDRLGAQDRLCASLRQQLSRIEQLPAALLRRAFAGEL